jgi:hypothetical protein
MPVTFELDPDAFLIRTTCSGHVTFDEVDAHFRELAAAWERSAPFDVLLDLTECTSLPNIWELRAVVSRVADLGGRKSFGSCAIIATREILFGVLRMFEVFADGKFGALRVFRSKSEAETWLSVSARRAQSSRP